MSIATKFAILYILTKKYKIHMSIFKEFKEFAVKGNVVDLAVGIIIGASFGKIVTSLVNDVIMPPIGMILGGINFSSLAFVIKPETLSFRGEIVPAITLNYGMFINTIIDFTIVAFAIFVLVKAINKLKKKEKEKEDKKEAKGPTEVELLAEIRDALKK